MWHEGTIGIPMKDGGYKIAHYWVKSYEEGSMYGKRRPHFQADHQD